MCQADVFSNSGTSSRQIRSKPSAQHCHMSEAADVDVNTTTFTRGEAAGIGGEELPMALLDVSVVMLSRREHEVKIALEIIVRIISAAVS